METFDGIKFNDLTEEQLDQMTETQIVNKALSEYVQEINNHVRAINIFTKHTIGLSVLMIVLLFPFGLYGLLMLIPVLFMAYQVLGFKKSMVWHVRSFKSTASMHSSLGFNDLVSIHEDNIHKSVVIGEFYNI